MSIAMGTQQCVTLLSSGGLLLIVTLIGARMRRTERKNSASPRKGVSRV
jgi:hypothetical protein